MTLFKAPKERYVLGLPCQVLLSDFMALSCDPCMTRHAYLGCSAILSDVQENFIRNLKPKSTLGLDLDDFQLGWILVHKWYEQSISPTSSSLIASPSSSPSLPSFILTLFSKDTPYKVAKRAPGSSIRCCPS